jgi:hypothetical protein
MKRLPEIIISCCLTFGLLTSGTTEKKSDGRFISTPVETTHDTTGLVGYLKVDFFNLEILPPSSGVQFFRSGIIFLSNTKYEGKMLPSHVSFGSTEAYTAIVKDTSLGMHQLFSPSTSFSYPCEAVTFSSDYKTMYFTKIPKKEKKEKIYQAVIKLNEKKESGWVADEKPLEFCTGNYIYTHPALSKDGKIMIFASDMAGTNGGTDLFIVRKEGDKWSTPENLGNRVNTIRFECFPYLDQDNNLFFSSDGWAGYGGYDIFTCKFNGESWEKPVNLSSRINSENDELAFVIDKTDGKSAFFTKRGKKDNGSMQLYKVTLSQEMADNNPLSISYIFNGKPQLKELTASKPAEEIKHSEEARPEVKEPAKTTPAETAAKQTGAKVVAIKSTTALPDNLKDVVVYRVQFLTTTKARQEKQIIINNTTYKTYEYFYLNAYRYTIGEFTTLAPAKELQRICQKAGYPQAFVAAFKNETRSLDLTLFK